MARGGKRGNPYRDANGRFASASTGRAGLGASRAKSSPAAARKAAKSQSGRTSTLSARTSLKKSRAKLAAKDPADQRLSSTLSNRAQRAAVTRGTKALGAAKTAARARLQGASSAGTISKNRPKPATATATARPITQPAARVPAAQRPGSMTNILGGTLRALAQADAQRIREIESITGQKVRAPKQPAKSVATVRKPGARSVSGTLGDNLRQLAQSDARFMRGMAEIVKDATPKVDGGKAKGANKSLQSAPKLNSKEWASLARLPGAIPFDRGRGQTGYFVPSSSLTPAKRNKLGLGAFKSEVIGSNFSARLHTQGSQDGWIISPKTLRSETPVQVQRSKSSKKPKTSDDLLTQATRIEIVSNRMSRAARSGARSRQIEERAMRAAKAARQRARGMRKPPSKAELKRREQPLNSRTTAGLNARLARDYAARNSS